MDEAVVRERAQAHGEAVKAGDLRRAAVDLSDEAKADAPAVMDTLPRPVDAVEIVGVEDANDECVVRIRYSGRHVVVVESRWAERDGRPMIVALRAP